MSRKESPEINAGSMADIAFLLLIFFLVTTTMDVESGIIRKIPKKEKITENIRIKEKNILEVNINLRNELFIDGEIVKLNDVKQIAIDFIDNAGGLDQNNTPCNWCKGKQLSTSSDHPSKAFISVKTDRTANYETYISVLDHLNAAYTHLRNRLGVNLYNQNYESLLDDFKKSNQQDKSIAVKIKNLREKYPLLLSDADMQN
ncbi:ExbD/TolR family protein [Polaribacter sp. R77954]|uniref:ExbD/TolR family protein n=1 Tax=Polaribacter sp. R77954 TaxID=3093870 RepID=UPI0037C7120B